MFLTETDFINMKLTAEAKLNDSEIIAALINDDAQSAQKEEMRQGERYYVGEHDILKKDFTKTTLSETVTDNQGRDKEFLSEFRNPNRSNHHNVNAFHRILVDQKASYLVGKEPSILVDGSEKDKEKKAYETMLADFADDAFNEALQDLVVGASNKGFEALHVYYDETGKLCYCVVPASELIPVYDTVHEKKLEQVIRYYDITVIKGNKKTIRKKVEWWTDTDVTYYIQDDDDSFLLDMSYQVNPCPHWTDTKFLNGAVKQKEAHSWGRVPFVILKNNQKMTTDLRPIKGLIDVYDLLSSEGTNNFLDLAELYWVIAGYGGETTSAIARKLQVNRAVSISDAQGKIEAKQTELPVAGRLEYLNMLRRDIFHFGMGVDVDADKFGNAPSGVSLKFQYSLLNLKAHAMAAKLRAAVKEFLWFITDDYNRMHGTAYDSGDVSVSLNYETITNDLETIQMIAQSDGIISRKTQLANHPLVTDVNEEMKQLESEEKASLDRYDDGSMNPNNPAGGEDE